MTELILTTITGLPEDTTKIVTVEEYNLEDKEIFTVIYEAQDGSGNKTEVGLRSRMFPNLPAEEEPVYDYDDCVDTNALGRLTKIALEAGWIEE